MSNGGQKIELSNGLNIFYEKVGHGPKVLLFLPGACGTGRSDFSPQLDNLDQDKFTMIAWDPPGYGNSRPPVRQYKYERTFSIDADTAKELMEKLGYNKYSLLGWSDGGKAAMFMAVKYPEIIESMILIGCGSYKTPFEQRGLDLIEDLANWDEVTLTPYLKVYSREDFQTLWRSHVQFYRKFKTICRDKICLIKCPTYFMVGGKDPLCPIEHAKYAEKQIPNILIKIFPDGVHNVHQKYYQEFNELATNFYLKHGTNGLNDENLIGG